jgi:tetratricopeptide (TPR) repeat protein
MTMMNLTKNKVVIPLMIFLFFLLSPFLGDTCLASIEAEILYTKGIQQYLNRDYGKARELLSQAAMLEPHNAAARHSLGLCYLALHEYEKARQSFRNALNVDPHIKDGHLYLGISQYFLRDYQRAFDTLSQARKQDPEEGLTRYYLALCAVQLDRPREAQEALTAGYRLRPEMAEHFQALEEVALVPKDVRPKSFRLEFQAGGEYDSNVPLIAKQYLYHPPVRKEFHKVDWAGRVGTRLEYYPLLRSDVSLGLRWHTFYNQHFYFDNWNWFDNLVEALVTIKAGPFIVQPRVGYNYTLYGAERYSDFQLYGLTVDWAETTWLRGELTYRAINKHFYYGSGEEYFRDGWEQQVGFFQGIILRPIGVLRLGAVFERDLAQGKYIASKTYRGLLEGVVFLPWKMTGWAILEFAYVDFDNYVKWAEKSRLDHFYQVQLLVKKPLSPKWSFWLGFAHTINRSSLDGFRYKRTFVPFFISYSFF